MVTGTQVNYYFICKRKLWLFSNNIQAEHLSEQGSLGKLLHETSYPQRAQKYTEIEFAGIKIDYYDAARKIIHEIKLSDKAEEAHEWQLKYYLLVLKEHGITGVKGILEYPKLKKKTEIELAESDEIRLETITREIEHIVKRGCPGRLAQKFCKKCAYYEFCWSLEEP